MRKLSQERQARLLHFVEVLESGTYQQGIGALHRVKSVDGVETHTFCCLGVACEVAIADGLDLVRVPNHGKWGGKGIVGYKDQGGDKDHFVKSAGLTPSVMKWYGFAESTPFLNASELSHWLGLGVTNAAQLNDEFKLNFKMLAHLFRVTYGLPVHSKVVPFEIWAGEFEYRLVPLETLEQITDFLKNPSSRVRAERPQKKEGGTL